MATYQVIDLVKSWSGKICEHSDFYLAYNGKTGYSGKICNPRDLSKKPYSEAELAVRQRFKQAREAVNALTAEQIQEYQKQWEAQKTIKYVTLRGFMFAKEYAKLKNE